MEVKDTIPISVAIGVFLLNFFHQQWLKRKDKINVLGNEIIHTCDKMIRLAPTGEQMCLEMRRQEELRKIISKDNEREYNMVQHLVLYYHKRTEEIEMEYDFLRADLKKNVKDFVEYWPENRNKQLILEVMERAIFIPHQLFEDPKLFDTYKKEVQINFEFDKIQKGINSRVMFDGVGYHLVYIQRLIDQNSPMLYCKTKELKDRLLERIKNYSYHAHHVDHPEVKDQ